MNIGIAFTMCSFFFNSLVAFVYFSKKRISNIENSIYSMIVIISVCGCVVGVPTYYFVMYAEQYPIMSYIVPRLYLIYLIAWASTFTQYVLIISRNKKEIELEKYYRNIKKVFLVLSLIFSILVFVLPLYNHNENNVIYTYGPAANLLFGIAGICTVIWLVCVLINIKNIRHKKYLPVLGIIILGGIVTAIQKANPGLLLITSTASFITTLMYFTIENPDVKMLQQMTLAKDMAEKANRAKSDFLSSMSHEIRTPLNAIVGLSEDVLNYKDQVPEEVALDVTDIQNASQTLLEIVGNILDINKIESEKMEIINKPYNLKEEIISLCKVTTTRIKDKPIEFKLDIAPDVPEELIGDKIHIKQVVNNLLSNAIKYTEQGNITLSVKCINEKDICKLIISVQDTGRGIKAENINKLFTKFERLDVEMNSTTEGTGLGLAITKSLVEMMGGKINVQSQFGKGSIFIVYLPQKISKHQSEKIDINELPIENQKDLSSKKILIVDDNKLNIKVAIKALQDFNFAIEECHDGLECLEKVKEKEYDLILMDIMMPVMSGESALAKLKENPEFKTPVIALTADAVSGAREKYIKEGFADYISKPFNKEQVKEKIEKIFTKKEEEINKSQMVTYVYDSRTNEEYIVKDGQRNNLNNQS